MINVLYSIPKTFEFVNLNVFLNNQKKEIHDKIKQIDLLLTDIEDLKSSLLATYAMFLEIHTEQEKLAEAGSYEDYYEDIYGERIRFTVYKFKAIYPYTGNADLLNIKLDWKMVTSCYHEGPIEYDDDNITMFFEVREELTTENVNRAKKKYYDGTLAPLKFLMKDLEEYNNNLPHFIEYEIEQSLKERRNKYNVMQKLGIREANYTPHSHPKAPIFPKQSISIPSESERFLNPSLATDIYVKIIDEIYNLYKGYEKTPSVFKGKGETALRDLCLSPLQLHFKNSTATGETFNKHGKTDISIKSDDGDNIFIAECKIWKGQQALQEALDQLIDRYVTIRDTKTALIVFVQDQKFTDIITKAFNAAKEHRLFWHDNIKKKETSFGLIFHHPEDSKIEIMLELMLFHFPK